MTATVCRRVSFTALTLALAGLLLSGCGEAIHNSGEDDHFIRTPKDEAAQTTVVMGDAPMLPLRAGAHWRQRITWRHIDPSSTSATTDSNEQVTTGDDTVTAVHPAPTAGGATVGVVQMSQTGQTKPYDDVEYITDRNGVSLGQFRAVPGAPPITLNPPLPLIHTPAHEGDVLSWHGTVTGDGRHYQAHGYSRLTSRDTLALPAGNIRAYRVDTVVVLDLGLRQYSIPSVRWFAPGIGVAQQRFFLANSTMVLKELVSYKIPRH